VPGIYFRLLLVGYFEGIDSERGIAWQAEDSLSLRGFLGIGLTETPPDHSTISRTRRLIDLETHPLRPNLSYLHQRSYFGGSRTSETNPASRCRHANEFPAAGRELMGRLNRIVGPISH